MSTHIPSPQREKCFFCLTTFGQEGGRKGQNKRNKARFEIIFNYLLQEEQKQNGSLLQSILQELRSPDGSNLVQFCSKCESRITKVSELHKELEVIQMKLIDMLKHVRNTIIDASRKDDGGITFSGNNTVNTEKLGDPQMPVPSLENDVQQDKGSSSITTTTTTRKIEYLFFKDEASATSKLPRLNISDAFQTAVAMRNQELFHIPFVYLERCTTFRPVVDPNLSSHEIGDTTCLTEDVDNDPLREAEEPDDFFPNSDDDNDSSFNEDHMEQKSDVSEDEYLSPSKKKKRKKNFVVKKPTRNLYGSNSLIVACDSCPFIAAGPRRRYHMSHHLLKHETDEKFLQCPHCPAHEGFSGEQLYNLHLSFHEVTSRCEYCQGDINDFDLAQHYRSHLDTVYRCQTCTFSSPSLESYLKHAFLYRTTVKCYICSAKFSVRSEFRSHLREEHGVVEKFSCDFESCGESYLSKSELQSHRRTHTNPYACECQDSCNCEVSRTGETILYGGDSCPPTDIVKIEPLEHLEVEVCGDNESWLPENYDDSSHVGEVNSYRCKNEEGAIRQRKLLKRLADSKSNTNDRDDSGILRKRRRRSRGKSLLKSDSLEAEDVEDNDSDDPWLPENDSNSTSSTLISDEDETRKKLADPDFSEDNEYKPAQRRKLTKRSVYTAGKYKKNVDAITGKRKYKASRASCQLKFACESCTFTIVGRRWRSSMAHHLLTHEKNEKTLKCPDCPTHEGFSGKQLFNLHLSFHEVKSKCEYCPKESIISFDLADHYYRNHVNTLTETAFQCQTCSYATTSLEKYIRHAYLYKLPSFKCYNCSQEFPARKDFLSHLNEHGVKDRFFCDFEGCDKHYSTERSMISHRKTHAASDPGTEPTQRTLRVRHSSPVGKVGEEVMEEKSSSDPDLSTEDDVDKPIRHRKHKKKSSGSETKDVMSLKIKRITKTSTTVLTCESCSYTTSWKTRLTHHLLQHETDEKTLKCPQCPTHEGFSGKQLYNLHLGLHKEQCECSYCENAAIAFIDLAEHYRSHVDTVYQCQTCAYPTTSLEKYIQHIFLFRSKTLNCPICSEEFSGSLQRNLLTHVHEYHGAIKKVVCRIEGCGKEYLSKKSLLVHERTHGRWQAGGESCVCEVCGKAFKNLGALRLHKKTHERKSTNVKRENSEGSAPTDGGRKIECDLCHCEEKFRRPPDLLRHKIRVHGASKFQCEQCGKMFVTILTLRDHVRAVHDGIRYPCSFCGQSFDNKLKLMRHTRRHRTPGEVTCTVCAKVFGTRASLLRHMRVKHSQ